MTFIQIAGSILSFIMGLLIFVGSKSAMQETVGACFFIASATLFAGGSITSAINRMSDRLAEKLTCPEKMTRAAPEDQTPAKDDQPCMVATEETPTAKASWVETAKNEIQAEKENRR